MLSIALFENEPNCIYKLKRTNYSYVKKDKPTPIRSLVRIVKKNYFSKSQYYLAGEIYSALYYANLSNYVTNFYTHVYTDCQLHLSYTLLAECFIPTMKI